MCDLVSWPYCLKTSFILRELLLYYELMANVSLYHYFKGEPNTELRSWLVTVGVEENFFHQQNWREHKERNLDEKRVSLTKSCPIPNSPKIWQNMIYSLLHIIISSQKQNSRKRKFGKDLTSETYKIFTDLMMP